MIWKALIGGLDSTREELVSRLKAAHAQARDAEGRVGEGEAAAAASRAKAADAESAVGAARCLSPRHGMSFNSRKQGSKRD